jgi:hypothetical protein
MRGSEEVREWGNEERYCLGKLLRPEDVSHSLIPSFPHFPIPSNHQFPGTGSFAETPPDPPPVIRRVPRS